MGKDPLRGGYAKAPEEGSEASGVGAAAERRQRLFRAMSASCGERGYEATSVADLLKLAGISRAGFYTEFANKEACFCAMLADAFERSMAAIDREIASSEPGRGAVEAALAALAEMIAREPVLAHACLIDSFAAGPEARTAVDGVAARLREALVTAVGPADGETKMPPELAFGASGAIYKVFLNRVLKGEADRLAELAPPLARWLVGQRPPPGPLRAGRRHAGPAPFSPAFARHDPAERILRATTACIAERGYAGATITAIAAQGRFSQRTFYEHFEGKEEAAIAAIDAGGAQVLAATMPAQRRAADWPSAVYNTYTAMCGFLAAEPELARLRAVEVYAIGPEAIAVRDRAGAELLEALLGAAPPEVSAAVDPLLSETIAAGISMMVYDRVNAHGAQELPEIIPFATYLTLAPLIGPEAAYEAVSGGGRRR